MERVRVYSKRDGALTESGIDQRRFSASLGRQVAVKEQVLRGIRNLR